VPFRERLFGLTIQAERLREIREERRPGSHYAQLDNCRYEVREAEYLMHQHPDMLTNLGLWERCTATDETFPCGALSDAVFDDDGDGTTAPVSRRETMYRLRADVLNTIPGIDGALSRFMSGPCPELPDRATERPRERERPLKTTAIQRTVLRGCRR